MKLLELAHMLEDYKQRLTSADRVFLDQYLAENNPVYPFNEFECSLVFLVSRGVMDFDRYREIRNHYVSHNKYLHLYGLAPRIFGQTWGEDHLQQTDPRFEKPSKEKDPNYVGEYDLWVGGVKVEVKACRAIDTKRRGDIVTKALKFDDVNPYWMNYQQLKFGICDVFVFLGVWVDQIRYWVLSLEDVRTNPYLSSQHRGGVEYQIGITNKNIHEFDRFVVAPGNLIDTIRRKSGK